MSDIKNRADALWIFYTGADGDGNAQADPAACLGGYRSSTRCQVLAVTVTDPIANLTYDYIAGANGLGNGVVTCTGTDSLTWTPPGGTAGPEVEIANGESVVLEGYGNAPAYLSVTRNTDDDLTGTATLTLVDVLNDAVGMDNVSSAEALAGDNEYQCICCRNEHPFMVASNLMFWLATLGTQQTTDDTVLLATGAGTVGTTGSYAGWPASGFARIQTSVGELREIVYYSSRTETTLNIPANGRGMLGTAAGAGALTDTVVAVPGIRIALENPTGSATTGTAQTIADQNTAPTGVTWSTAITQATGVTKATLGLGEIVYVWIHRQVPPGMESVAKLLHHIKYNFESV